MKPSDAAALLDAMLKVKCPPAIHFRGAPGTAKTSLVYQCGERNKLPVFSRHPVFEEPVDQSGVPFVKDGRTHWAPPDFIPVKPPARAVLLIDELPQCEPAMQKAYSRVCLERRFGDVQIPDWWLIVTTGNRVEDRSGAFRLLKHLSNRLITIDIDHNLHDFQIWGEQTGAIIGPVREFLFAKPDRLLKFDPAGKDADATPRSWEQLSKVWDATPDPLKAEVAGGTVGKGTAIEFTSWLALRNSIPDPALCIRSPEKAPVPSKADILQATATAVAELARQGDKKEWGGAIRYANRLTPEHGILLVKILMTFRKDVAMLPEAHDFMRHRNILADTSWN